MNCKQGDIAIVVRSTAGNEGLICQCIRFLPRHEFRAPDGSVYVAPSWEIDRQFRSWDGSLNNVSPDSYLRPIRDPGDDARDNAWDWLPAVPTKELA